MRKKVQVSKQTNLINDCEKKTYILLDPINQTLHPAKNSATKLSSLAVTLLCIRFPFFLVFDTNDLELQKQQNGRILIAVFA